MILGEETFKKFHYYPSDLPPQSHKPILAACGNCGKIRATSKNHYRSLCKSCVRKGEKHFMFNRHLTEEWKANISAELVGCQNSLGYKYTEEQKANLSALKKGENNPNWQNGVSFEPYCIKFNKEYKEHIRDLFGNECFLCGKSQTNNGKRLSVHHVNYNKTCGCDGTVCMCIPLCIRCHLKTNYDRDFWQCLITEMLKPFVAWV